MDVTHKLVSFIRSLSYDSLPEEVVSLIKQNFLDFCGNTLAGTGDQSVSKTIALFEEWGGKPECSVFMRGLKLPAVHAVLLNATMSFAVDFDDTHMRGGHIGVTVFPPGLAVSEMKGGVSGRDFITAIVAGTELMCRLGTHNALRVPRHIFGGWEYHALHAPFSTVATAGKLLSLDQETFMNAMGLAYQQASGTGLAALEHADTKTLGTGFGCRNGLTSIFLAQRGLTGAHNILEGDYGMGRMYHNGCDAEGMVSKLGEDFELLNMGFKPFASCRLGHRTLAAVRELIFAHDIKADEVVSVKIKGSERVVEQLYTPEETTKKPDSRNGAVFSLPWVVSSLLLRRKVGVGELSEAALADKSVRELASRVFAEVDKNADPADHAAPMPVVIKTKRGDFETKTQPIAPGDRGNRLSQAELEEKFYDNASFCVADVSKERLASIVRMANSLEQVSDMREVVGLLS